MLRAFVRLNQPKASSIASNVKPSTLSIYPNPASNVVNVSYPKMKQLIITDITGRTVRNMQLNNVGMAQINVSTLPKGIYLVKVLASENVAATQKLIVQ